MEKNEYLSIVDRLPRYPLLVAAMNRTGAGESFVAHKLHMTKHQFRACMSGKAKPGGGFNQNHWSALQNLFGESSIEWLSYTPSRTPSANVELAILSAAVAYVQGEDLMKAAEKATVGLSQKEAMEIISFYAAVAENAECLQGLYEPEDCVPV